ncbi:FecR domain-containing protein [Caldithrix abyssi]
MKIHCLGWMVILFFTSVTLAQEPLGKVTFPIGKNFLQHAGQLDWQPVKYHMPVLEKDRLKTGKQSRCEITFKNKKVMRIGENSVISITRDKMGNEQVEMSRGRAWISLFLKGVASLVIKTPTSVCAVRGTVYRLESDSNMTRYRCYEGALEITPLKKDRSGLADTSLTLSAGQELILVMNFEEYKKQQQKEFEEFKKKDADDFEQFIKEERKAFEDMVAKDLAEFKQMQDVAYKMAAFDAQEDANSDWVQWNKERDRLMQEGE